MCSACFLPHMKNVSVTLTNGNGPTQEQRALAIPNNLDPLKMSITA